MTGEPLGCSGRRELSEQAISSSTPACADGSRVTILGTDVEAPVANVRPVQLDEPALAYAKNCLIASVSSEKVQRSAILPSRMW